MMIPHEPWLVALSIAIAIQGSFVGLSLARGIDSAEGFRRKLAIAGSAITLATGVWSMHFVAMLAADFPSAVDYLALPTLISFLICVIVVGIGAYAAHAPGPPALRIGTGALAMGLGVSLMHYVGMSAVHLAGPTSYAPSYVVASIAVSIAASAFALWTIDSRPTRPRLFLGAIALGLAISGMHYTAMAGMRLDPLCYDVSLFVGAESALSRNTLALLATVVAFGVSGAFLLSLVPDARVARVAEAAPTEPAAALTPTATERAGPEAFPEAALLEPQPVTAAVGRAAMIRVEKDGRPRDIAVSDVYAIRANAHYTYIHDGEKEYFCSLSISALEAQLDPKAFLRVHRSYIVSVDRIARIKRSGEAGVAELGLPVRCSIPIARAHYRQVKLRIGAVVG
jgi:NO-binding membrane sensor protein with MHYT domain